MKTPQQIYGNHPPDWSWVELPDSPDSITTSQHDDMIAFVRVDHDDSPENPCEWGTMGTIRSFSNRHINHVKSQEELNDLLESNPDAVALSYFEHGQCRWGVMGTMSNMPDFRWDGVEFAGIWIPEKDDVDNANALGLTDDARAKFFEERAESACKIYTYWANGEVYGYHIRIYKIRKHESGAVLDYVGDYRHDEPIFEDSCYGFYGWEDLESQLKEALGHVSRD